ncbi:MULTISPECIES: hypothetical protein [unclassified Ensifer]|uniref:hypothetical protein n=1 Tax=unclassified Ensifer TaxID=2633371 RepID=UPI00070DD455|nr:MULTISPECIES: hypothetical protein [unclassified Ensifer]KQW62681.1 hypothetical protein ASD02_00675 [Ensifer sp. Root1252]KRC83501.1 hypothetical protein ASE32_00670 [Ensifer sp. Root231]KRC86593.1 hypothetical protein ASE47_16980 [Ensifer sp. Root258]
MSLTTAFVAELIWAANQSQHLTTFEKRRLLERAVVTIRDMREQAGIPSSNTEADAVIDLQSTAAAIDKRTDEQIQAALLDAADMIRTLRILLDTGTEVVIKN